MDALLFPILLVLATAVALYWIIRLAVHHGVLDADRTRRDADRDVARGERTSLSATVRDSRHAVPDPEDRP
jgi:hypothetical protein